MKDDVTIAMGLQSVVAQAVDAEILLNRSVAVAKKLIEKLIERAVDLALLSRGDERQNFVTNGKTFEVTAMLRIRQVPLVFRSGSR